MGGKWKEWWSGYHLTCRSVLVRKLQPTPPAFRGNPEKRIRLGLRLATSCPGASSPRLTQAAPRDTPCPTKLRALACVTQKLDQNHHDRYHSWRPSWIPFRTPLGWQVYPSRLLLGSKRALGRPIPIN